MQHFRLVLLFLHTLHLITTMIVEAPYLVGKRKNMVAKLKLLGITNEFVLAAMMRVKRHLFVNDSAFIDHAYENKAFQIGCNQTISAPYTVAFQTSTLDLKKGDKVLEIGTGSGYQLAVLVEMGVKVFSIERQKELFDKTKALLTKLNYKALLTYGDGYKGLPMDAPFDKIIVTAAAPYIPEALVQQLKPNGLMIIPVGDGDNQEMKLLKKLLNGDTEIINLGDFRFVPMLKDRQF